MTQSRTSRRCNTCEHSILGLCSVSNTWQAQALSTRWAFGGPGAVERAASRSVTTKLQSHLLCLWKQFCLSRIAPEIHPWWLSQTFGCQKVSMQRIVAPQAPFAAAFGVDLMTRAVLLLVTVHSALSSALERHQFQQLSDQSWLPARATFNDPSPSFVKNFTRT